MPCLTLDGAQYNGKLESRSNASEHRHVRKQHIVPDRAHARILLRLVVNQCENRVFCADALRDEKVKVIRAIGEMTPDQMRSDVVRGQYGPGWVEAKAVQGYRSELQVDPASETETYIAARFEVDDWRWSGVPFYLRTGKRLPKRATEIAIQFKAVPHRLFRDSGSDPDPNLLARDPFTQGDQSITREHNGLGLGLFAAARIAEMLGGSLTFDARRGGGSVVRILVESPAPPPGAF